MILSRTFISISLLSFSGVAMAQPKGGDKISICHATGNEKYNPLSISVGALDAHADHGDVL
jgi:hypothetical protein